MAPARPPLAIAFETPARAAEAPKRAGTGPTYAELAKLPVMHEGRKKPFDTRPGKRSSRSSAARPSSSARPGGQGHRHLGPVGALFNRSVRPEFWDDQPIILVEYIPLKRSSWPNRSRPGCPRSPTSPKPRPATDRAAKALIARKDLAAEDLAVLCPPGHPLGGEQEGGRGSRRRTG